MNLFEKIIKKIVGEKTIEPSLNVFEKRFQDKLEYVYSAHDIVKSYLDNFVTYIKNYVEDPILKKKFFGDIKDAVKYIEYLQELNRMGLIEYSGDNFETVSSEIVDELKAKKKEADNGRIQKKFLQEIVDEYKKTIHSMTKDFPFLDKSSYFKFLKKLYEYVETMQQDISKFGDEDFVEGVNLDVFNVHKVYVTQILYAVEQAFCGLKEQLEMNGPHIEEFVSLINKMFKVTDKIKDPKYIDELNSFRYLHLANSNASMIYRHHLQKQQVDTSDVVSNIQKLTSNIEIKKNFPTIDFNLEKLYVTVASELAKNEEFNQILETNKVENSEQLMRIAQLTFEAIQKYMKEINLNFVFDVDYIVSYDVTSSIAMMSQSVYEENKQGIADAELYVYQNNVENLFNNDDSAVKKVFTIVETILHETGHRLDLLRDEKTYIERRDNSCLAEVKEEGFLSKDSKIDRYDVALLMHLSPSLAEHINKLKEEARKEAEIRTDCTAKQIFDSSISRFVEMLNIADYYKNEVEIFARHFSAEGTAVIVQALKHFYAEDIRSITTYSEDGNPAVLRTKNGIKSANLNELDHSNVTLIDPENHTFFVEFHEGDNEEIYLLTEDKMTEEIEKEIEEIIKLCKCLEDDLKHASDCSLIIKMMNKHIEIGNIDVGEKVKQKAMKILNAYVNSLSEQEFKKVITQAMETHCKPVVEAVLITNPNKIIYAYNDEEWIQYFEYLAQFGLRSVFGSCDNKNKERYDEIVNTILKTKNFVAFTAFTEGMVCCDEDDLIDFVNNIPEKNKHSLEYEAFLSALISFAYLSNFYNLNKVIDNESKKYNAIFKQLRKEKNVHSQARYDIPALKSADDFEGLSEKEMADKFMEDIVKKSKQKNADDFMDDMTDVANMSGEEFMEFLKKQSTNGDTIPVD